MAKTKKKKATKAKVAKLYTLTEVSTLADISMPTLQRYKKSYQDRIPSIGEGRSQRYPKEAIKVLQEIKQENMAKRGRPKKAESATPVKPAAGTRKATPAKSKTGAKKKAATVAAPLLSLAEIERITGISYPTLLRYVKINLARIPHMGEGRKRRYQQEAVAVFQEMRAQSSRGGRKVVEAGERAASVTRSAVSAAVGKTARVSSDLGKRIKELESTQSRMAKQLKELLDEVRKPIEVTLKRR